MPSLVRAVPKPGHLHPLLPGIWDPERRLVCPLGHLLPRYPSSLRSVYPCGKTPVRPGLEAQAKNRDLLEMASLGQELSPDPKAHWEETPATLTI